MRIRRAVVVLGLTVGAAAAAAEPETRLVTQADARQGPGSYYAPTVRMLPGASVKPIERRDDWVLAEVQSQRGWIPAYTLASAQEKDSPGRLLRSASKSLLRSITGLVRSGNRPSYVNYSQATLGIRGFAEAFAAHRGDKLPADAAALWEKPAPQVDGYDEFLESRFHDRDWAALKRRVPLDTPAPLPDPDNDKLGAALAAVIARQHPLKRDPAAEAYLSSVATLVAESSHAYDVPVRVYIIDSPKTLGYVTPHGIVFVSTGALRKMRNEAEFAFFVGHEIAHIAFGHGPRKLARDEQRQRENAAFADMEEELEWHEREDDKYVRTSRELTELADQVHEYFQSESNDADELAADRWGLIYAARAGYVPEAAEAVLLRIAAEKAPADKGLLWRGTAAKPRLEQCRSAQAALKLDRKDLRSFEQHFQDALKDLDAGGTASR